MTRTADSTAIHGAGAELTIDAVRSLVEPLLPAYLLSQRWFGSKSKRIVKATMESIASFASDEFVLMLVHVFFQDETCETYQLPLGIASEKEATALRQTFPKAVFPSSESFGGVCLYDASISPAFQQALLSSFENEAPSNIGATVSGSFTSSTDEHLRPRLGSAEQSNTSIFLGDKAILKLFRRLQPGANPEVEMTRFLSEIAHFRNIPAYMGEMHSIHPSITLGVMQAFAPNQGDGWEWYSAELKRFFETAREDLSKAVPVEMGLRTDASKAGIHAARVLGLRTGEMHLGLATPTNDTAFTAEDVTAESLESEQRRIEQQAEVSLRALQENLATVPTEARTKAETLLGQREAILRLCRFVDGPGLYGKRIRIHGDYHLGQTLRVDKDFLIVDFEGEPALALEARRRKQSPLKDVAGMLRSFSYAARSSLGALDAETRQALSEHSAAWESAVTANFIETYIEAITAAPGLLPTPRERDAWLEALLLEKAMYELLYELNNRPDWVHIPLDGLLALVA